MKALCGPDWYMPSTGMLKHSDGCGVDDEELMSRHLPDEAGGLLSLKPFAVYYRYLYGVLVLLIRYIQYMNTGHTCEQTLPEARHTHTHTYTRAHTYAYLILHYNCFICMYYTLMLFGHFIYDLHIWVFSSNLFRIRCIPTLQESCLYSAVVRALDCTD